jgi:hypothetical protein
MDATEKFLAELNDPAVYVPREPAPIFRTHERKKKNGKLVKVDLARLRRIVAHHRDLEREATFAVIPLGHTNPDPDSPEDEQPDIAGVWRNLRIGKWGAPGKESYAIWATPYFRRDMLDKVQQGGGYPFRSAEYFPERDELTHVALLKRAPELDLGIALYGRDGTRENIHQYGREDEGYRYTFEANMADETMKNDPTEAPDAEAPDPQFHEQFMRCMRHSYPHMDRMHGEHAHRYEAEEEPEMGGEEETPPPVMDDEAAPPPVQNGRAAMPSATNSGNFGGKKKGGLEQYRRGSTLTDKQRIAQLEAREAKSKGENWVLRLSEQEGYEMDEADEVQRFARAYQRGGDGECEQYANRIRAYHRLKPTVGPDRIRTEPATRVGKLTAEQIDEDPTLLPPQDAEACVRYARQNGLHDMPMGELAKRALPRKYGAA